LVVVRFAPSPTGYLHIGGARTAIFNWLFAKQQKGKFLLRIEDTDQARSTKEAVQAIFDGLQWLGLNWEDEPVFQSQRKSIYKNHIDALIKKQRAYFCFCSAEQIEASRQKAISEKKQYIYDRKCLKLSPPDIKQRLVQNSDYVVRFLVPDRKISIHDQLHGKIEIDSSLTGDFIIQRSDGTPIYQFAVVVDDHEMGITHVIRGDDHLSNAHKQVLIYDAFGWHIPDFVHIPLIHGANGKRLSKRHGATAVHEYADRGILPEAMLNFLALLGWSSGDDREFFSRDELIGAFSLSGLTKGSAVFDEKKLEWMNAKYIAALREDEIYDLLLEKIIASGLCDRNFLTQCKDYFIGIFKLLKPRSRYLTDFLDPLTYFINDPADYDPAGIKKYWNNNSVATELDTLADALKELKIWSEEKIEKTIRDFAGKREISAAKLIHPTRLALTGRTATPGLFEIMALMGRETVVRRLTAASRKIKQMWA
jgi:glutamyl-tRNA synthetase